MLKKLRRSIDTLGILDDDMRRSLYLYVRKEARPITPRRGGQRRGHVRQARCVAPRQA